MLGRSLIVALALFSSFSLGALAQDPAPEPGADAAKYLPEASKIGSGWVGMDPVNPDVIGSYNFEMNPDVFRQGASRVYLGPDGSRVVVVALLITENRVAVRQSWEDATDLMDVFGYRIDSDYSMNKELESAPPPAECIEAKRTAGSETLFGLPAGVTMCAADPDVVLIVGVFGSVAEVSGTEAADMIASMALVGSSATGS